MINKFVISICLIISLSITQQSFAIQPILAAEYQEQIENQEAKNAEHINKLEKKGLFKKITSWVKRKIKHFIQKIGSFNDAEDRWFWFWILAWGLGIVFFIVNVNIVGGLLFLLGAGFLVYWLYIKYF